MRIWLGCFILLSFFMMPAASFAAEQRVSVLVWDLYFDFKGPAWPVEPRQGTFGNTFRFMDSLPSVMTKPHGLQISYVLMKDNPFVDLHLAYNPGLPWQDPEKCALVDDLEFQAELSKHGYPPLPNCRKEAEEGIGRLSRFIREHQVQLVNMSHGVYYDNYVLRNPYLLKDRYPLVDIDYIQKFLYKNFLAIGEVVQTLFRENPDVLFVVAAGNNDDEVDRYLYLKWDENPRVLRHVPTLYASFTSLFPNLISVASTYDGVKIAPGSNYGEKNVFMAKKIGDFSVPDGMGGFIKFGGTSAAAAETSRVFAQLMSHYGPRPASEWKQLAKESVTKLPKFSGLVSTGGVLDEKRLARYASGVRTLPVREVAGVFRVFSLPESANVKGYGCHSLAVDQRDRVWMTMPWSNSILAFDPITEKFTQYPLPTPASKPDGIAIDSDGMVWFGLDPKGGLGKLHPDTGQVTEYPHPLATRINIIDFDLQGRIWGTSHDARTLSFFDPRHGAFLDRRIYTDWPLDVRADVDGIVWAAGLKGYSAPWKQGALVRFDSTKNSMDYFPLPEREERLQAYWVFPAAKFVYVTLMRDGFVTFAKGDHSMVQWQRDDANQIYNIVRSGPNGKVVLTNAHEKVKSLDFIDADHPSEIVSFRLPDQHGEPREGLDFDSKGNVWYCQTFSPVLGRLTP